MHVAYFGADVVLAAQEVQAEGAACGEIDTGGSFGDFCIGKKSAAADLEIRNQAAACGQRPLEGEGIYANAVSGVRFLNNQKERDGVNRIFEAAAQETWAMRGGEAQAVTEAYVPDAVTGLAAIGPVAPAGPDLQFVTSLNGTGLRAQPRGN